MKELIPSRVFQGLAPYVTSGLLFALSWPNYPYVRLEILAWVWTVPMLLALKSVKSFWRFLLNIYLAMFIFSVFGMSWLITSTTLGAILLFFVSAFIQTVPFVAFFFMRQTLGWRVALWSAPVVWTAWEWLYQQSEGSIGWLGLGPSLRRCVRYWWKRATWRRGMIRNSAWSIAGCWCVALMPPRT